MAGIGPHLASLYYSIMAVAALFENNSWTELLHPGQGLTNLLSAGMLLGSGPFALLGGWTGMAVYYAFQPPKSNATASLANDDYVVIEGRLTTTPVRRSV